MQSTRNTAKKLYANEVGEFEDGCTCGSYDFYAVVKTDNSWEEIDPVEDWDGWACINCKHVYDHDGTLLDTPSEVKFLN